MGGGALEVAMPGAALVLGRRVQVYERVHGLHNDPQLLPPRERLGRGREVAHAPQVLAVRCCEVEPRLQAAAHHQREDEARRRRADAVAKQRQQVRVAALPQDRHLSVEVGQLELAQIGPLYRHALQPLARLLLSKQRNDHKAAQRTCRHKARRDSKIRYYSIPNHSNTNRTTMESTTRLLLLPLARLAVLHLLPLLLPQLLPLLRSRRRRLA